MNRSIKNLTASLAFMLFLMLGGGIQAKDFVALQQDIDRYAEEVESIESREGRYDFALIEPLRMLAATQLQANLFSDAGRSVDRAIQIARFSDGLYTPVQYPLLKLEIEIELARSNWKQINEKLEHYTWLISQQYTGKVRSRLEQARWIADVRIKAYYGDSDEMRAPHLIKATYLRETAVQYAQVMRQTKDPLYGELLFDLASIYRLEAEAIRQGGSTGYQLRRLFPGLDIVEEKRPALDKRYRVGLEKLESLKQIIQKEHSFDSDAVAMINLYLADWHDYFGHEEEREHAFVMAMASLAVAGLNKNTLRTFLDQQREPDWQRLHLDLDIADANLMASSE